MNKNFVIAIVAVLVLFGIGYWIYTASKADENTPTPVENNSTTNPDLQDDAENKQPVNGTTDSEELDPVTITFTDNGFSPSTVTIKLGQKVIFKNNGSVPIEPASDDHPTHTDYSEFDSKNPVAVGGTYEFTFAKRGSWGYHDHLNSNNTGIVVVE